MFCTECGNKLDQGTTFCTNCGARVENNVVITNNNVKGVSIASCIVTPLILAIVIFILPWIINIGLVLFEIDSPIKDSNLIISLQIILPILIIIFGPFILYAIKKSKQI